MSEKLQGPTEVARTTFWPYDIFGYLMPGLVVIGAVWVGGAGAGQFPAALELSAIGKTLLLLGASYVVGHGIAAVSSLVLERWVLRRVLGYPTVRMFPPASRKPSAGQSWTAHVPASVRTAGSWGAAGLRAVGAVAFPGYSRAYTPAFRAMFDETFARTFGAATVRGMDEHDRFWLAWEYISLHHGPGYKRGTHFVELYGFNRNASASCFICALLPQVGGWTPPVDRGLWVGVAVVAGVVLFQNYVKLIRRMNDEVFRAFAVAAARPLEG